MPARSFDSNTLPHHHFFDVETGEPIGIEIDKVGSFKMPEPSFGKSIDRVDIVIRLK